MLALTYLFKPLPEALRTAAVIMILTNPLQADAKGDGMAS